MKLYLDQQPDEEKYDDKKNYEPYKKFKTDIQKKIGQHAKIVDNQSLSVIDKDHLLSAINNKIIDNVTKQY